MTPPVPSTFRRIVIPIVLALLVGVALFARAMDRDLNHDEHQFLAPGALLAHQGAEPYKDYPFFHLPNLVFVYAALAKVTDYYLVATKSLSALATAVVVGLLLLRTNNRPAFGSWRWSLPVGLAVVLLLVFDPLFLRTTGKTWNHELPACLVIIAFCCHVAGARSGSLFHVVASGVLVSLAIGTRLTLLPVVLPFVASIWFFPTTTTQRRIALFLAFGLAGTLAMAPTLYYYFTAHDAFVFGNVEFPRLRLVDPTDTRAAETASVWRKMRYFVKEIVMLDREKDGTFTGSLLLFIGVFALAFAPAVAWLRGRKVECDFSATGRGVTSFPLAFSLLILPFTTVGCALPTRYQYQHWFVVVPFLALVIIEAAAFANTAGKRSWKPILVLSLALFGVAINPRVYFEPISQLTKPSEWYPFRMHGYAEELRSHVPEGKILTLAPAWPSEAGLPFYPEFAIGPFAWRLSHLLDPAKAERFHVTSPSTLQHFLEADPPAGILTGVEDEDLEESFTMYAQSHGYHRVKLAKKRVFWVRP